MTNQRIDIDANRWVELRDGLVYFVRFRKRGLEIAIAPWERVRVLEHSEFTWLGELSPTTFMCILAIPILGVCALAIDAVSDATGLHAVALAALLAVPVTMLLGIVLGWAVRKYAGGPVQLSIAGSNWTHVARMPLNENLSANLPALLNKVPNYSERVDAAVPQAVRYTINEQSVFAIVSAVGTLVLASGSMLLPVLADDDEGGSSTFGALSGFLAIVFGVLPLVSKGAAAGGPADARKALYERNLDRASILLARKLAEKPKDPPANYLAMAPALLKGDLEKAAGHAAIYEESKREAWNWPQEHSPTAQRLRALMAYERGEYSPSKSEQAALHPTTERVTP